MTLSVDIHKKLNGFSLDIQFAVGDGIIGMLGMSGCGKSMTLKCIAGIETPDSGTIILNGRVLFDSVQKINLSPQERKTGYLFQNYALFPHMTVAENIAFGSQRCNEGKKYLVNDNIKSFYLDDLKNSYPRQLSGGEQQRVALARVFASEPDILMLDEPFSALDSHLRWQVERETMRLLNSYKKTILLVSHDRDEVYRLCDKVAVIYKGRIECISDKHTVFNRPQTLAASKLTGCKNHSAIRKVSKSHVYACDWQIELETVGEIANEMRYIGIRAHFFRVSQTGQEPNQFKPEIIKIIEDVFCFIVIFRIGLQSTELVWMIEKAVWLKLQLKIDKLILWIPPEQIIMLK